MKHILAPLTLALMALMISLVMILDSCDQSRQDDVYAEYDGPFPVIADYDLSIEKMLKAGRYGDVDSDITSAHFPSSERGKRRVNVLAANFLGDIDSDKVLRVFQRKGLRPLTLRELLALASQYPHLADEGTIIIALGSTWKGRAGVNNVVALSSNNGTEKISLCWTGVFTGADYRFVAVRE
jgi:hypothetical protein